MAALLDRLDRCTGGDAAHDRHRDRPRRIVLGDDRPRLAKIALDDAGVEAAHPAIAPAQAVLDRVGQLDDLDGAGAVGQPPDEATLIQRGNQPVNAGFGAQVQRVLHFVEGRRHAGFGQPLVDEPQEFELFARQHRLWASGRGDPAKPRWRGIIRNKA